MRQETFPIKKYIFILSLFACIACHENNIPIQKTEFQPISLLIYDSSGYMGQLLTLANTNRADQEIRIFIKEGESHNISFNTKDTIIKFGYSIEEIFIYGVIGGNYKTKVICVDKKSQISFDISPVEAIEIARYFSIPIFIDNHLIENYSFQIV